MRKKEESGVNPAPAMNCRAILISPYGTEKPFLSLNRVEYVRIAGQIRFQLFV